MIFQPLQKRNSMKNISIILAAFFISVSLIGQAPQSFKYQAVLRDGRGNIRANTEAGIIISILQGSATGAAVYSETHKVTTDAFGIININLGTGTATVGTMSVINWGSGLYFIKITVDGVEMGTGQLLSVPYALYANNAGNGFSGNYNDLTNKPVIFNGTWASLTGKPTFSTVATSGSYNDLNNKPKLFDSTWVNLRGKPTTVAGYGITDAFNGTWSSLTGKPTGNNIGDMLYWNGTAWVMVPVGQAGQYLQLTTSNIPAWTGAAYPTVTTTAISSITQTTAISGGNVTNDGGAAVTARGVCWSTTANPTTADNKTSNSTGSGAFTSSLSGLTAGTTYYVRAYATNSVGTVYGTQVTFSTVAQVYGLYTLKVGTDNLCFVDLNANTITKVANIGMVIRDIYSEIKYKDNKLYITQSDSLFSYDLNSGVLNFIIKNPHLIIGISFNSAGELYALHELTSTAQGTLYKIDITTNTSIKIGTTTGSLSILGIKFDSTDQLWAVDEFEQKFGRINTSTGIISFDSPQLQYVDMLSLTTDNKGYLYSINYSTSIDIVRYDILNKSASSVFPLTASYSGLEYAPRYK
jgi:hypothetical protein